MFAFMKKRNWRRNTTGRWSLEQIRAVVVIDANGCWIWQGAVGKTGYGYVRHEGRTTTTHRVAYVEAKGPIPDGLEIDHLCRTRPCCNPDHLEAVTTQVNSHRGISLAAQNVKKTHCPKGHPYDRRSKKGRQCSICLSAMRSTPEALAKKRAYRRRKREEAGLVKVRDAAYYEAMALRRQKYQDEYREANREKIRAYHRGRKRRIRMERLAAMEQATHQG